MGARFHFFREWLGEARVGEPRKHQPFRIRGLATSSAIHLCAARQHAHHSCDVRTNRRECDWGVVGNVGSRNTCNQHGTLFFPRLEDRLSLLIFLFVLLRELGHLSRIFDRRYVVQVGRFQYVQVTERVQAVATNPRREDAVSGHSICRLDSASQKFSQVKQLQDRSMRTATLDFYCSPMAPRMRERTRALADLCRLVDATRLSLLVFGNLGTAAGHGTTTASPFR